MTQTQLSTLLIIMLLSSSLEALFVKTTNLECSANESYIANLNCRLKPLNRTKAVINMDVELIRKIENVTISMQLLKKNYANKFLPFLVKVRANVCDMMESKAGINLYLAIFKRVLKDYSNINHSCPFSGHLWIRDLYLDSAMVPVAPPVGVYRLSYHFNEATTKDLIAKMYFQGEIRELKSSNA
ncbi:uncharacterized protein LOC110118418 [Ceratitis capitata]|uniref:uncharacterized protein LOC110118418 n=1 Tax=Ceratitis capitata TaxID=7213 RepID=UPI000A10623B|nr:uncharacterized protein LOC110118418 [Ceratitis capitata]